MINLINMTQSAGFCVDAQILSTDARSNAPGGMWTAQIIFKPLPAADVAAAVQAITSAPGWSRMEAVARAGGDPLAKSNDAFQMVAMELFDTVLTAGVEIVPRAWSQSATVSCNCPDFHHGWCKHIAALGCAMVTRCESDRFLVFKLSGIQLWSLLPERSVAKRTKTAQTEVVILDSPKKGESSNAPIVLSP